MWSYFPGTFQIEMVRERALLVNIRQPKLKLKGTKATLGWMCECAKCKLFGGKMTYVPFPSFLINGDGLKRYIVGGPKVWVLDYTNYN